MMQVWIEAEQYSDPEQMASAYLSKYFGNQKIEYPINPFKMLKDEGILFSLMDFKKLEGVYIPANSSGDVPVVGINANRPITRQRFSAAHELCHHFRDANKQITCPIGSKSNIEKYAEGFAAALLMPINELRAQVNKRKNSNRNVSMDDVLEIADFFGVSFQACLFRIAYLIHAIPGNTEPDELRKRSMRYGPEKERRRRHMTYTRLYSDLIDCYQEQLAFKPTDYARYVFQNEYIYNDSRMEGLDVTIEQASEIVTDLRLNMQNSKYCSQKEEDEVNMSIAGHYKMYQEIFAEPIKDSLDVYYMFSLNKYLFSYYPYPEFGGSVRQNNTLVLGAKFETVDYHEIFNELTKVDEEIRFFFAKKLEINMSDYIKHVVRTHHKITVIHPFPEGNGRTSRAFMNVQFVRAGITPIYIRMEDKREYVAALSRADLCGDYDELYEIIFKLVLRSCIDLHKE